MVWHVEVEIVHEADGLILVPVGLPDGTTQTFILDTGAGMTVLSRHAAVALDLADRGRRAKAHTATGAMDVRITRLDTLSVGGMAFDDLRVAVADFGALEGLLGFEVGGVLGRNFFERVDVGVDLVRDRLDLWPAGGFDGRDGFARLPFEVVANGLLQLDAVAGGDEIYAILDLGANATLTNRGHAERLGATATGRRAQMVGADDRPIPITEFALDRLALGEVVFDAPRLAVCEDADCSWLFGRRDERVIVGLDLLASHPMVFSYDAGVVWMAR